MNGHRHYKGYVGVFQVDDEANVIRGKVINTKDTITFQGRTVEDAVKAFCDSVDDFLNFCESLGEPPEKPFSGKFLVRLRPEVHRALSTAAQIKGVSFNKLVSHELRKVARRVDPLKAATPAGPATVKLSAKPKRPRNRTDSEG
ncbi:Predicted nuclease of the RNAse H fold, HicB family [Singulisphaera sp. GP187]|uniref:type II toxin-antitoxin system HicB family antitoxin n=1 Tax=Singulisphaera sp. GP187 TaxID=1882752 RepID=UPI000928E7A5|nr:type II toxin-antitoxin system HicB family antitoxin [Singulisphaera sp. GP187]SIO32021.1 Predicted nuclease of the RNAse H fold, HicB family [Singulisphaera sp. GP187]